VQVNDKVAGQSVVVLQNSFYLWNVGKMADINLASLSPLVLLQPTIELLVIGTGQTFEPADLPQRAEIDAFFCEQGVGVEWSSTPAACATFNVLNTEDRLVAAALLTLEPSIPLSFSDVRTSRPGFDNELKT
jgi:uncharacterized protein